VQWVLFNPTSRLIQRLRQEPGWRVAHEDPVATLLVRDALPVAR
jgi:hypothetical protein